jgi:hypothetical protein
LRLLVRCPADHLNNIVELTRLSFVLGYTRKGKNGVAELPQPWDLRLKLLVDEEKLRKAFVHREVDVSWLGSSNESMVSEGLNDLCGISADSLLDGV